MESYVVAQVLRDARERAGLTRQQLAARAGVTTWQIDHWERGNGIEAITGFVSVLLQLARAATSRATMEVEGVDSLREQIAEDFERAQRRGMRGVGRRVRPEGRGPDE